MKKEDGYDILEASDLKLGMVLKFRDLKQILEMNRKKIIIAGWDPSMNKFVEKGNTIEITKGMLDFFKNNADSRFKRGTISDDWIFSLSMFEIQETKEEITTTISEEERGTIMKLGEIFVSNEKETLREALAAIQPEKCLNNLKTYLLSGMSDKGAIEKCFVVALRKKLPDFMVLLHVNASKDSVEDLLTKILKSGFSGFAQKDVEYCIGDLNQYNSIDSYKLVVEFMTETLDEVIADAERTAKEKELLALKSEQERLVKEEKERAEKLKELQKQISELEA